MASLSLLATRNVESASFGNRAISGVRVESRIYIEAKSGISRAQLPDPFMIALYRALAPYRGCGHGCRYCDGRAEKYFVEGDFERDIAQRENLPERIAADIAAGALRREYGAVGLGSGVTDLYQPLEAETGLTRQMLTALVAGGSPVSLLTKSALVLRDFDLLAQLPQALVMVTITTLDPDLAAILEPGASPPAERLEVVRRARAAGFHAGVMAMPLCPGLSDDESSVSALLDTAKAAGAEFVWPGGLTLRPGRQKDAFLTTLATQRPDLTAFYERAFGENRPSGMPLAGVAAEQETRVVRLVAESDLPSLPPPSVYGDLLGVADRLFVLFCHMQTLYRIQGVDIRPLRAATTAYGNWLKDERSALRRRRTGDASDEAYPVTHKLDQRLAEMCASDEFAQVCGNAKLARLARAVVIDGREFDYRSLRLVDTAASASPASNG